jgi:hypothetical protein
MNSRIRYSKEADGSFISMRIIISRDGNEYRVVLSPDELTAYIINLRTADRLELTAGHRDKVKRMVKKKLKELGCRFLKEERSGNLVKAAVNEQA